MYLDRKGHQIHAGDAVRYHRGKDRGRGVIAGVRGGEIRVAKEADGDVTIEARPHGRDFTCEGQVNWVEKIEEAQAQMV